MPNQAVERDSVLTALVSAMLQAMSIRRIILFGSRSTGKARPDSDYDLLVVADTNLPPDERALVLRKATREFGVPLDILVYSVAEHERLARWKSSAVAHAESEGAVVYESE